MLQCSLMGRPSLPRAREGQPVSAWRSERFHQAWFLWPPVVTRATDNNTDPIYSTTMDPEMALGSSSAKTTSWLQGAAQATQISMDPDKKAQSLDTIKATGCCPDSGLTCDLWWQHGSWTSTQTLTATQTWSLAAARTGCLHCTRRQHRSLR